MWISPLLVGSNLNCVAYKSFSNGNSLAIVVGDFGVILKSTDDRNKWDFVNLHVNSHLNIVEIINENQIVITGNNKTIIRSTNGGLSWISENLPKDDTKGLSFPTQTIGYLCLYQNVFKTTNTGVSWNSVFSTTDSYSLNSIYFFNKDTGLTACLRLERTVMEGRIGKQFIITIS